jgi:malonyl-CoA/methylmalonyl-CoA synthetase
MTNLLFDTLFHHQLDDAACLLLPDGSSISYGDLLGKSAKVANTLARLGVKPGDRVAAQVGKSIASVSLYLGSIRAGAVFLPLNTAYTATEVEYFINDARPTLLVCRRQSETELRPLTNSIDIKLETLDDDGDDGSWFEQVKNASDTFTTVNRTSDDLAAILYTSGTTGRSKGAMITHQNLASNAKTLVDYWHIEKYDVLLHALPIFHTHGLFVAINSMMIAGASVLFLARFDAEETLRFLPGCTLMMGVPTFYSRLLALDGFNRDTSAHMRLFISGSAPMTMETHKAFEQRTGQVILERYGMTETNMNTSNPYEGERIAGSVGFPLPGVELRITDADATEAVELPQGEVGIIEVRGDNVFKGYWQMPEKTAEEIRADGFFITGDLGKIDEKGYVHIVGRSKDLIISGGFNVYPKEIEIQIDQIDGVVESAVVGVAHADFGEAVVAVIVTETGASITEQSVINTLTGQLAKYKMPKRVFFIDELPRNAMSKVQKNSLRDDYKNLFQSD